MKKIFLALFIFFLCSVTFASDVVFIEKNKEKSKKIALVILNGIGDSKKNRKAQMNFFNNKGMDVFIPDYKQRSSLDESLRKFTKFYDDYEIEKYKEVYFMCYIIGGYVLNRYIETNGKKNIKKIIYDRSPTQERAAKIGVDKFPFITRLFYGKIVVDFSEIKLKSLSDTSNLKIGVIIENQATRLMRFFEKSSYKYGSYTFDINNIEKKHNDFFHTWLDHDLMYKRFDIIGEEIIFFFKNGYFSKNAKRKKYDFDPFKKIRL